MYDSDSESDYDEDSNYSSFSSTLRSPLSPSAHNFSNPRTNSHPHPHSSSTFKNSRSNLFSGSARAPYDKPFSDDEDDDVYIKNKSSPKTAALNNEENFTLQFDPTLIEKFTKSCGVPSRLSIWRKPSHLYALQDKQKVDQVSLTTSSIASAALASLSSPNASSPSIPKVSDSNPVPYEELYETYDLPEKDRMASCTAMTAHNSANMLAVSCGSNSDVNNTSATNHDSSLNRGAIQIISVDSNRRVLRMTNRFGNMIATHARAIQQKSASSPRTSLSNTIDEVYANNKKDQNKNAILQCDGGVYDVNWYNDILLAACNGGMVSYFNYAPATRHTNESLKENGKIPTQSYIHNKCLTTARSGLYKWPCATRIQRVQLNRATANQFLSIANTHFYVWDMERPSKPLLAEMGGLSPLYACSWNSHSYNEFMIGGEEGHLRLLDVRLVSQQTNKCVVWQALDAHSEHIRDIHWSPLVPDWVVSCSMDGNIHIWDIRYGTTPMRTIKNHTHAVNSIRWSPSHAEILCSGGSDNRSILHNLRLAPHYCQHSSKPYDGMVAGVTFNSQHPLQYHAVTSTGEVRLNAISRDAMSLFVPHRQRNYLLSNNLDEVDAAYHNMTNINKHLMKSDKTVTSGNEEKEVLPASASFANNSHPNTPQVSIRSSNSLQSPSFSIPPTSLASPGPGQPLQSPSTPFGISFTPSSFLSSSSTFLHSARTDAVSSNKMLHKHTPRNMRTFAEEQLERSIETFLYLRDFEMAFRYISALAQHYSDVGQQHWASALLKLTSPSLFQQASTEPDKIAVTKSFTLLIADLSRYIPSHTLKLTKVDSVSNQRIQFLKLRMAVLKLVSSQKWKDLLALEKEILNSLDTYFTSFASATSGAAAAVPSTTMNASASTPSHTPSHAHHQLESFDASSLFHIIHTILPYDHIQGCRFAMKIAEKLRESGQFGLFFPIAKRLFSPMIYDSMTATINPTNSEVEITGSAPKNVQANLTPILQSDEIGQSPGGSGKPALLSSSSFSQLLPLTPSGSSNSITTPSATPKLQSAGSAATPLHSSSSPTTYDSSTNKDLRNPKYVISQLQLLINVLGAIPSKDDKDDKGTSNSTLQTNATSRNVRNTPRGNSNQSAYTGTSTLAVPSSSNAQPVVPQWNPYAYNPSASSPSVLCPLPVLTSASATALIAAMESVPDPRKVLPTIIHRLYFHALLTQKRYDILFILATSLAQSLHSAPFATQIMDFLSNTVLPKFIAFLEKYLTSDKSASQNASNITSSVQRLSAALLTIINILYHAPILPEKVERSLPKYLSQSTTQIGKLLSQQYETTNNSAEIKKNVENILQQIARIRAKQTEPPYFHDLIENAEKMLKSFATM